MRSPRTSLLFFSFLFLTLMLAACGGGESGGTTPEPTEPTTFTLTVTPSGTGSGTVTAPGISCGTVCTESFSQGTSVTLTATPDSGSTFTGWGGACSGTTCTVAMDSDKAVTATFDQGSGDPVGPGPGPDPDPPVPDPIPEVVSGTIQEWVGQAAVLKVEVYVGDEATVLQEVQITPDGAFSFTLPGTDVIGQYLFSATSVSCEELSDEGVTGTGLGVEVTPSPLQLSPFLYLNVYASSESEPIGFLAYGVFTESLYTFMDQKYAGSSGTITGSCSFTGEDENGASVSYTDTYNVNLASGWNELITEIALTGGSPSAATTSTGSAPAGSAWYYVPEDSSGNPEEPPEDPDPVDPPEPPEPGPVDPPAPPGGPPAPPAPGTELERLIPHRLFR